MKLKIGLSLIAVLLIAIATIGTVAYFTKSFTSDNNTVTAASFEVDTVNKNGTTIGNDEFTVDGKLYPGMETIEAYSFMINKNNTEVPVEYKVNLTPNGDLFPEAGDSPIKISLQRNLDNVWTEIDYSTTFKPAADTESFKIFVDWPHGDNDIDFQGKTGNIKLEVIATQVDEEDEQEPEEPEEDPDKGSAFISLFRDSTSSSNKIDFVNISNFTLKNKQSNREYTVGTSPWNNKSAYEMKDIPKGEYTIHFDAPNGMSVQSILLGDTYKETEYNAETNPIVITKDNKSYAKIILKSSVTLQTINPLADLKVAANITLDEFKAALPTHTTIVDSSNQEHQVDLSWDIRPFNFENYKKPGTVTLKSEFFKLPVNVSNSVPSQRLEVALKVIFE